MKTSTTRKKAPTKRKDRHLNPQIVIRAPQDELDEWRAAASSAKETLAEWLREAARQRLSGR